MKEVLILSWSTWQYKPFWPITGAGDELFDQSSGEPRWERVRFYSRTFPHAIQGHIAQYSTYHNRTSGSFSMRFIADCEAKGPTEIRVNPRYFVFLNSRIWYPNGLVINIIPSSKAYAYYDPIVNENLVILLLTNDTRTGDEIYVEILEKNT